MLATSGVVRQRSIAICLSLASSELVRHQIAAFFMELLQPEGGPSILMMVAGLIVFSVGSAFFGGLGG